MRIRLLEIENFRGIEEGRVVFQQHTLLVGGNNVGKSTVCEALELVLGPEHLYQTRTAAPAALRARTASTSWRSEP